MSEMRTEQFPVRMTRHTKALLRKLADADKRSMNDIVLLAVLEYAEKRKVKVSFRKDRGVWR